MFANILYVVDDDSRYLLMDRLVSQSEALSGTFLNRQHSAQLAAQDVDSYDLLIVDHELEAGGPWDSGQHLVRHLLHQGARLPVLLISDLENVTLDPETVDWVSDHRLELISGSPQAERELVRAIVRATERSTLDVLVLEQDPDDYQVIEYCLRPGNGYKVISTHATGIEDAARYFSKRSFDAYLIAHRVGDHNSNELLRELVSRSPDRPIILLTDHDTADLDESLTRLLGRRRYDVLSKQALSTETLRNALQRIHAAHRKPAAQEAADA